MGSESNVIRVYFCTAFRDMHAERAYLHEVIFPRLTQQFQERGYVFEAVDPRWTAQTEEEAEGFGTLEQALDQIESCRPYFIGILGSNYGKVLLEVPDAVGRKHPGIKHYFRCSRVHLETLLGALREPQKAKHSFFFFRKPDFLDSVPEMDRKTYLPNNVMEQLNEVETHKLEVFKGAISTTGLSIMEYDCRWDPAARKLTGLEDFGEKVAAAILSWIGVAERPVVRKATSLIGWTTPAPLPPKTRPGAAASAPSRAPAALPASSPFDETIPMAAIPEGPIPEATIPEEEIHEAAAIDEEPAYGVVSSAVDLGGDELQQRPMMNVPAAEPAVIGDEDIFGGQGLSDAAPPPAPPAVSTKVGGVAMAGAAAEHTPSPYLDKNVQFSVYRPKVVQPEKWETLLAFAHLAEKAADAPEEEPDPVEEVQRQAQQVLGQKAEDYVHATKDSTQAVPREGELTFVPELEGFQFNPPQRSFLWTEPVHREEFRMMALADMDGKSARGRLSVFLGSILLADVPLTVKVDSQTEMGDDDANMETTAAQAYRKIFASYSHKDTAIVEQFKHHAKALGDRYLQDCIDLRAGEDWNDRLKQLIGEADVFQLFWSSNSMHSPAVRKEWEHALKLMEKKKKTHFVRPTYWEDPLPEDPGEDLPPEPLRRLHFQKIFTLGPSSHPSAADDDADIADMMDEASAEAGAGGPMADMAPAAEAEAAEAEAAEAVESDETLTEGSEGLEASAAASDEDETLLEDESPAVEEAADMDMDMDSDEPPARSRASAKKAKGGSKKLLFIILGLVLLLLGGAAAYLFLLSD